MIRPPDFVLSRLAVGGEVVTLETAKYLFSAGITHNAAVLALGYV